MNKTPLLKTKGEQTVHFLLDRKGGRWFPTAPKGSPLLFLEAAGRSLALVMRFSLRKNVGVESYNLMQAIFGFGWLRLFTMLTAHHPDATASFMAMVNPVMYTTWLSMVFNIFSVVFLVFCLGSLIRTEIETFRKDPTMNVKSRGITRLFAFLIDRQLYGQGTKKPFIKILQTEGFVQGVIEPLCLALLGLIFYLIPGLLGISMFLILGSFCYGYDEINYVRAKTRLERIQRAQKLSGGETVEKQKEYGGNSFDIYM